MAFLIAIAAIIFFVDWLFTPEKSKPQALNIKMTVLTHILIIFWLNVFYICCTCKLLECLPDNLNMYGHVVQVFMITIGILKPLWNIYSTAFKTVKKYNKYVKEQNSKNI